MRTSSIPVVLGALLLGCSRPPEPAPVKLVVVVVIDQLPWWSFVEKEPHLRGGLRRLVDDGVVWTGEYPYAATFTAPGHAAISTGAPPSVTGIIANEWWQREEGRDATSVAGPDGPSPRRLRVEGVADRLLAAHGGRARAVSVSLKDRSAILALGRRGTAAVWYDAKAGVMTTSSWYGERPTWLDRLGDASPIRPRLDEVWRPADPDALRARTGHGDDAAGEVGTYGLGATFPHALAGSRDPARALVATPLGNRVVVEAGLAALDGERLGRDDAPDLLVLSFSAHDYVGHAWGQESWEAHDALLRLDQDLDELLRALDERVGPGEYAVIVTSDHGAAPLVERTGGAAVRLRMEDVEAVAEEAAAGVAGAGDWIASARPPAVYLAPAALALPADRRELLVGAVAGRLATMPGLAGAWPTAALAGSCAARPAAEARRCLSVDRERSGEVYYTPAEGTIVLEDGVIEATGHGSEHAYDRLVPIVLTVPGAPPGRVGERVSMLRVAPTIARLLAVPPPAAATEPPLTP